MAEANDSDLLRQYADRQSEAAFTALVQRHINLVYSVAWRYVGNVPDAQDVTQAVFLLLARKAAGLRQRSSLTGWLYETTRLTARQLLRTRYRRQLRDQEVYMQSPQNEAETAGVWRQLEPLLEEAMTRLSETERALLALLYFENRTGAEAAALLGIGEWAAHKRAARALEKLRKFFARHGVDSTAAGIAETISTHSVQVVPAALAHSVAAVALTKGAVASASTLTLIQGALKIMAWTKAKTVLVGIGILLIAGTGAMVVTNRLIHQEPSYQGRRLTAWLPEVDYGQPPEKRQRAGNAIRHMGTKVVPYLLADLGDQQFQKYSRWTDVRTPDARSRQATWAFDALGPLGRSAISELVRIMEKNPGYVPSALAGIGPEALPELLGALTNQNFFVRDNAAGAIANAIFAEKIQPEMASAAYPIALQNLTYTHTNDLYQVNTRSRAAWLLAALHLSPETTVPALIRGLQDSNETVVCDCAFALAQFGNAASPAVPALLQTAASTNARVQRAGRDALEQIERKP
ncbi:MAG TPA: sigma-70 family RNA polymerase sigma factor [Dongiaceae bacterium]|nr:sigma-70 family RNA polymerase sigma factor [Dongiaceae bacterium]